MRYFVVLGVLMSFLMGTEHAQFDAAIEKHDYERAKAIVRPDAVGGNAKAMFDLGLLEYVTAQEDKALVWFRRSTDKGERRAELGVGIILFSKDRAPAALKEAASSFRKVKDTRLASDFLPVISDLLNGTDTASAQAYFRIALLYHDDLLIFSNDVLAAQLMQHAADKGLAAAALEYAKMLLESGAPNSIWDAQHYFEQAAHAGSAEALYRQGKLYLEGPTGFRDLAKGEALMGQARKDGYKVTTPVLEKVANLPFLSY